MNFKAWLLNEAAYRPVDMPDGVVVVRIRIAGKDPYFYFADADSLEELEEDQDNSWSRYSKPHGHISVHAMQDGTFRVNTTVASDGWGPLLHDLAMEYATVNGKGLGPDYKENSPDSMGVWNYYHQNREDVSKKKITKMPDKYKDWKAAHYLYSKKGNEVTEEMLSAGLLVVKS